MTSTYPYVNKKTGFIKYLIGGAVLIFAALAFLRSCRISDEYSTLKGSYRELEQTFKTSEAIADKQIAEKNGEIDSLNGIISGLEERAKITTERMRDKDARLGKLQGELRGLTDKDSQIVNLKEQINILSEKFTLAEAVIVQKNETIAAWEKKFDAQVTISETWKQRYEQSMKLLDLQKGLTDSLESKVKRAKLSGNIKNIAIVAIGAYCTYSLLAKK